MLGGECGCTVCFELLELEGSRNWAMTVESDMQKIGANEELDSSSGSATVTGSRAAAVEQKLLSEMRVVEVPATARV